MIGNKLCRIILLSLVFLPLGLGAAGEEGPDGKIYFGTHLSAFFGFATFARPEGFPGGHLCPTTPTRESAGTSA